MITVYTKKSCPQCDVAKSLLGTKQQEFKAVTIGDDVSIEEFRMAYPQVKAVPFIVNEDVVIGGVNELKRFLADK